MEAGHRGAVALPSEVGVAAEGHHDSDVFPCLVEAEVVVGDASGGDSGGDQCRHTTIRARELQACPSCDAPQIPGRPRQGGAKHHHWRV